MNIESFRAHCIAKRGVTEEFPFDKTTLVFKVMGKMFALVPLAIEDPETVTLKCDPNLAILLRQKYKAVTGAYHFNKTHWNGILLDGSVPDEEVLEWADHSYALVVKGLTKAQRNQLNADE